jgi:hypothetical protein
MRAARLGVLFTGLIMVMACGQDAAVTPGPAAKPAAASAPSTELQPWDPLDPAFRGCEGG